jgi:molybdopterin-binding protein
MQWTAGEVAFTGIMDASARNQIHFWVRNIVNQANNSQVLQQTVQELRVS